MKKNISGPSGILFTLLVAGLICLAQPSTAAEGNLPVFFGDRGTGMPTSMFGTYVRQGELLVYPFIEYYRDNDMEYKPTELGHDLDEDFRGKYRAVEGLIFIGYGVTDWLAIELEAAYIDASLEKSSDDRSTMPDKIEESGLGDVEGQIRARFLKENERRPEVYGYFEAVAPTQRGDDLLIGTPDWEFKAGLGVIKGFSWGTMTVRAAMEYSLEESKAELGEYAVEYLKRLSPAWRIYLGVEGSQDEIELIPEVQWLFSDSMFLKVNSAFGLTSKATDWAPEIGVMFAFPVGGL